MATTNNEAVGHVVCDDCGEKASLHIAQRGKREHLYKRCFSAGCVKSCDQSTSPIRQKKWRQAMVPVEGFEHWVIEPEQPKEPSNSGVPEPKREPEKEPNEQPKEAGNAGVLGLLVLGVVSTVVLIAKAARGGA